MAAGHIDLPGAQNLPSQTFTQDSVTVDAQEIVLCDASGNVVGVTSNRLDVNVGAALPAGANNIGDVDVASMPADSTVKLRGSHASTISSRTTGLQSNPVLDVRLVEDALGTKIGQDQGAPLYAAQTAARNLIYSFTSAELTLATSTGTKEMLTCFHASSVASEVQLLELRWFPTGTPITAGRAVWEYQFITAENGTPGGTTITPQELNRGNGTWSSSINLRQGVSGAPTTTAQIFGRRPLISFPNTTGTLPNIAQPDVGAPIWDARQQGAIVIRASTGEGWRLTLNILATLTGAQTGYLAGTFALV